VKLATHRGHVITVVNRKRHYCGYIETNREFNVDNLYEIPVDAPGGITYHDPSDGIIGFDTGHANMVNVRTIGDNQTMMGGIYDYLSVSQARQDDTLTVYTEARVLRECEHIVDQLEALDKQADEAGDTQ